MSGEQKTMSSALVTLHRHFLRCRGAPMRMSDFVVRDSISANLIHANKDGVIREMVDNLRQAGYFPGSEPEDIVKQIMQRELLGSTGIGRGVAIPHTKHTSVDKLDDILGFRSGKIAGL